MCDVQTRRACALLIVFVLCFATVAAFAQKTAKGNGNSDLPGTAGQQAAVDRNGKLRAPTPEEMQVLTAPLVQNESAEGLVPRALENGAVAIDLQGRFESSMLAKQEADGSISEACVTNVKQAEAFLNGEKPAPQTQPELEVK